MLDWGSRDQKRRARTEKRQQREATIELLFCLMSMLMTLDMIVMMSGVSVGLHWSDIGI